MSLSFSFSLFLHCSFFLQYIACRLAAWTYCPTNASRAMRRSLCINRSRIAAQSIVISKDVCNAWRQCTIGIVNFWICNNNKRSQIYCLAITMWMNWASDKFGGKVAICKGAKFCLFGLKKIQFKSHYMLTIKFKVCTGVFIIIFVAFFVWFVFVHCNSNN